MHHHHSFFWSQALWSTSSVNCLRIEEKKWSKHYGFQFNENQAKIEKRKREVNEVEEEKIKKNNKVSSIFSYGITQVRSVESQKRNKRIAHNSFL